MQSFFSPIIPFLLMLFDIFLYVSFQNTCSNHAITRPRRSQPDNGSPNVAVEMWFFRMPVFHKVILLCELIELVSIFWNKQSPQHLTVTVVEQMTPAMINSLSALSTRHRITKYTRELHVFEHTLHHVSILSP